MIKVILEDLKDNWQPQTVLKVFHNDKLIMEHYDGGEPEDNMFSRDWNWVPSAIETVYNLGREDFQNEKIQELEVECNKVIEEEGYQEMADGFCQAMNIVKGEKIEDE